MNEECLICKEPLEYLNTDEKMERVLCHHPSGEIHEQKTAYRYEIERCDLHSLALEQSMQTGKNVLSTKTIQSIKFQFCDVK